MSPKSNKLRLTRAAAGLAIAGLVLSGCSAEPSRSRVINRSTISVAAPTPVPTLAAAQPAAPTSVATDSSGLPGELFDRVPPAGTAMAVVGVEAGSFLNVRELPGTEHSILTTLTGTATALTSTGRARLIGGAGGSVWYEIATPETTGWASSGFLAAVGRTAAGSSQFVSLDEAFDGPFAVLDQIRTNAIGLFERELTMVVVDGPTTSGTTDVVVMDILGFTDDSVLGNRLRVIGEPGPRDSFVVVGVETTILCRRGVSADLLCI